MMQNRVTPTQAVVLHALSCLHKVSGYNPTIGEIAKVAGVSYGVAYRALEKLCGYAFIQSHVQSTKKVGYRFSPSIAGNQFLSEKGQF